MLRNYFILLLRNLYKRRIYSLVNLVGLAIGIASFLLIMLFVADELSYDRYYDKSDRIYRVCMEYDFGGVGENSARMPFPVAFTLQEEHPDLIESAVRIFNFQSTRNLLQYEDLSFIEKRMYFADSTYFRIFNHEFISGDPACALVEPNSIVLTETMARKYFGDEDPMGKVLKFESDFPMKVTGVIRDVPLQTHFIFDCLGSMNSVKSIYQGRLPATWVWNPCWTYLLLDRHADIDDLEEINTILSDLTGQIERTLQKLAVGGYTVTLKVRYSDFTTVTRSKTLKNPVFCSLDILFHILHSTTLLGGVLLSIFIY